MNAFCSRRERRRIWNFAKANGVSISARMWGMFGCYPSLTTGKKREVRNWMTRSLIPALICAKVYGRVAKGESRA